jgi:hypothetical protein
MALSPGEQLPPAFSAQDGSGRKLVRGRDEDGVGVEAVDADPVRVDRLRDELQPECADALVLAVVGRVFDRDSRAPLGEEEARQQIDALCCSLHDDDLRRVGDRTARSSEVVGEHAPQIGLTPRLAVVEPRIWDGSQDMAEGGLPLTPWEERHVGRRRSEVVAGRLLGLLSPSHQARERADRRHQRRGTRLRDQESLRLELRVGVAGDPTGNPDLCGECPR